MKLLAIDTATEACSAALYIDGEVLSRFEIAPRQHARLILPMIDSLLSKAGIVVADLDALAFGRGPGGFTGVRIATGVIQGIGFATELPVVPVSTLAALAQGAWREFGYKQIATAIDARMGEVYWGRYTLADNELMQLQDEELVIPPEQVEGEGSGWVGIGSGWTTYSDVMQSQLAGELEEQQGERFPNAHDIALLAVNDFHNGVAVNAAEALPIYLRDKVAKKKGEQ